MVDQEASNEIVIIGREEVDATQPFLSTKVIDELLVLRDAGSDCRRSSGQTGDSSVDVRCCRNVEVPAFQVARTKKIPEIGVGRTLGLGECTCQQSASGPLFGGRDQIFTCSSDLRIVECGEQVGQESHGPEDIVIGKNGDRGPYLFEALDHLKPLVCFLRAQDLDSG